MKTRTKSFFKVLSVLALVSTLTVSCGKNNKSGGGKSSPSVNGFNNTMAGAYGVDLNIIGNEYPCTSGNQQRIRYQRDISNITRANVGTVHVGVTAGGDIAVISGNQSGQTLLEVFACPRAGLVTNARPEMQQRPVIQESRNCSIPEITAADFFLQNTQGYYYQLKFYPIGLSAPSRYCQ